MWLLPFRVSGVLVNIYSLSLIMSWKVDNSGFNDTAGIKSFLGRSILYKPQINSSSSSPDEAFAALCDERGIYWALLFNDIQHSSFVRSTLIFEAELQDSHRVFGNLLPLLFSENRRSWTLHWELRSYYFEECFFVQGLSIPVLRGSLLLSN